MIPDEIQAEVRGALDRIAEGIDVAVARLCKVDRLTLEEQYAMGAALTRVRGMVGGIQGLCDPDLKP